MTISVCKADSAVSVRRILPGLFVCEVNVSVGYPYKIRVLDGRVLDSPDTIRHNNTYMLVILEVMMGQDPKVEALRAERSLNPHPEAVTDRLFLASGFMDARDVVQVKYEMVRRVRIDGETVSATTREFGFSRPTFYEAQAALERSGLAGLVPARPGPRRAHKLTAEVVTFAQGLLEDDPSLSSAGLAEAIGDRFGMTVHPRSVERALARAEKAKKGGSR